MIKSILMVLAMCLVFSSLLNAEDLVNQYKQKMLDAKTEQHNEDTVDTLSVKVPKDDILEEIQNIKKIKQGTFESTPNFITRRKIEIKKLDEKASFYAKKGDDKFRFGSVTMKSYDADTERMFLSVKWDKGVYKLFPELKRVHTAYLDIPRGQASDLFGEKQTHNFHVKIGYVGDSLLVTRLLLYDQYRFYPKVKRKPVVAPVVPKKTYQPTYASCDYFYTNASSINVRSRPTTRSTKNSRLSQNKKVCITKKSGSWYYIKNKGWILSKYLQKTKVKKVKKVKKQVKRDRSVWHCTARSVRASGWVERVGKENAKRGALRQCTMRLQTNTPCRITNCYRR